MTTYTEAEQKLADTIIELGGAPIGFTEVDTDEDERRTLLARHMNLLKRKGGDYGIWQQAYADAKAVVDFCGDGFGGTGREWRENAENEARLYSRLLLHVGAGLGDKTGELR